MPETVFVHVGGCGVRLGDAFWRQLAAERAHVDAASVGVDEAAHFIETSSGRWRPRAVFADFDNGAFDGVRGTLRGEHGVDAADVVACGGTSGGQWGRGHYTDGAESIDAILDRVGRHIESCDSFSHVHLTGSLAGGTGSGLGTLAVSKLYEWFRYRDMYHSAVVPNFLPTAPDEIDNLSVYNVTLAVHQLIWHATAVQFRHNEPDGDGRDGDSASGYAAANQRIAREIAAVETLNRYETGATDAPIAPGALLRSLIPFPRLMFLATARHGLPSGVSARDTAAACVATTGPDVAAEHTQAQECLLGVASICRYNGTAASGGGWSTDVRRHAGELWTAARPSMHARAAPVYTVNTTAVADNAGGDSSVTTLVNRPANVAFISRLSQQFTKLFRRKAFLHWYTGEGMDEMEFTEAESNMNDIVDDYNVNPRGAMFTDSDWDESD